MDATDLDEDFVNFESVSQTCSSSPLDDELSLLDNEASQREQTIGQREGDKEEADEVADEEERNNNRPIGMKLEEDDHQLTGFGYNPTGTKRLTMIPIRYKMKEERRRVLKISINKLKKIDDPESWLCRSVLINNTMKKLQKEARDEKMHKQMNAYSKNYHNDEYNCQLNNNNNNQSGIKMDDQDCFYQKEFIHKEKDDVFCYNAKTDYDFQVIDSKGKESPVKQPDEEVSISSGVPLNEDFVEKIPSIKRCASRKRSLDEDGSASEILNLDESGTRDADDVDECDVHDVLSQLYMPPTPRMLTSIDSDTDDDELNVVDMDASYMDGIRAECQNKLPGDEIMDSHLLPKRRRNHDGGDRCCRPEADDLFGCFSDLGKRDNFLCESRAGDKERTSGGRDEDELIELEDEEDIKRRLSQSLTTHYHRKGDKGCDNFFDDGCDSQYSCGHTVNMFNDIQSVTFHNLIASLET